MNKIEVAMYARTEHYGIRKICNFVSSLLDDFIEDENKLSINKKDIVKVSYNIIDLIEVGDYVNGRIIDKYNGKLGNFVELPNGKWEFIELQNESYYISSIVTKEQFESMKYKVGGSNEDENNRLA